MEREVGDSMEIRQALDTKMRELEDAKAAKARLENEIFSLKTTLEQERIRARNEIGMSNEKGSWKVTIDEYLRTKRV